MHVLLQSLHVLSPLNFFSQRENVILLVKRTFEKKENSSVENVFKLN